VALLDTRALERKWLRLAGELAAPDVDFGSAWADERRREMDAIAAYLRALDRERAATRPFWRTYRFAVLAVAVLVSIGFLILLLTRASHSAATLDLRLEAVSFVTDGDVDLALRMQARQLSVRGLDRLEYAGAGPTSVLGGIRGIDVAADAAAPGVYLDWITIARGSRVTITWESGLTIEVAAPAAAPDIPAPATRFAWSAEAEFTSWIESADGGDGAVGPIDGRSPAGFVGIAAPGARMRIHATPRSRSAAPRFGGFASLPIRDLEFAEEIQREGGRRLKHSFILEGNVTYPKIDIDPTDLRFAEELAADAYAGNLIRIAVDGDALSFCWSGRVEGLRAGYGDSRRSLMPSLLEVCFINHTRMFAIGMIVYVVIFVAAVLRGETINVAEVLRPSNMTGI
jgi:hypothetical protein